MKQIKNYKFTTGCWIFVLATIFALNSKITLAMDTPCKEASHTLGLSKHKIDFNSLINSADKERIEIHFFWTTGRPYDWLKDEHEADRTVNIGGNRWSRKFQSYIQEFLKFVPQNVNISFTCDQLTAKSNATLFNSLSSNFGKRFQLRSWESLTTKIYAEFPEHKLTLKRFFDQGFCGNPAISSDVYRLVGMPIAYGEEDTRFDKTMWVYTDIDAFTYALEHEKAQQYIHAILSTISGNCVYAGRTNNDVIKQSFSDRAEYKNYVNDIIEKLIISEKIWCSGSEVHPLNYIPMILSYAQQNDFDGYLKKYETEIDRGAERNIINLTGPKFLETTRASVSSCLDYPGTCALEWNPINYFTHAISGYTDHIDTIDYSIEIQFEGYLPHLRRAMITKRLGRLHPFNAALLNCLKKNNPYMSEQYKQFVKEHAATLPGGIKELKEALLEKEIKSASKIPSTTSAFFRMRSALKSVGVEFPIVPEGCDTAE